MLCCVTVLKYIVRTVYQNGVRTVRTVYSTLFNFHSSQMKAASLFLLFLAFLDETRSYRLPPFRSVCLHKRRQIETTSQQQQQQQVVSASADIEEESELKLSAQDMTGYGLLCKFSGFGVVNMTCTMEFKSNNEVKYGGGIESLKPGQWRVIRYSDGRQEIEATLPLLPEHMYLLDLWDSSLLLRGELDMFNMRVSNGEMVTNKKRFCLIPYKETVGTFEADLFSPKDKLPVFDVPKVSDLSFLPPEGFNDPRDMKKYPQLFDPEFVEWWFAVEDSMARGQQPPMRPRAFFTPSRVSTTMDSQRSGSGDDSVGSLGKTELRGSDSKSLKGFPGGSKKGGFSK